MAEIKEACGVFGIYDLDGGNVVPSIYYGLTSLQHRGQESCGLAVCRTDGEQGNVQFHKDLGLVSEVLREKTIRSMRRKSWYRACALFHNRSFCCRKCTASCIILCKRNSGTGT